MKPHRKQRPAAPISAAQRTVIMIICTQFGISKSERQSMLLERYGKASTADLSSDQAGHFIKEFEGKGFVLKPNPKKSKAVARPSRAPRPRIARVGGKVIALASQDELDKVKKIADLIEWRVVNGLQLFLQKRMSIRDGRIRTAADAYMAIEGLKKMFENGMKAKHGPAWWLMKFENPAVQEYVELHCPEEWR